MDEKIKKLYDNLLSGGLTVEQIGTPDTFAKNITDSASNKAFYEKMLSSGKFTVEQIGTYDTFAENTLGSVKKKDTPQTPSPLPEGWRARQQEVLGGGGQPSTEPSKLASESPAEPLSPQSDTTPPLEDKTSIFEPYNPMKPPSDGEAADATVTVPPPVEGLDIDSIKESVRSDLQIEDEAPVMTPAAYAEDRKITPAELNDPSFKNMFTREGKLTTLDVEAADIILEKIRLGESALAGQLTEVPVIKQWINEYPAAAPLFNFLQGVNRGLANTILPAIDGAQKMFYDGIGAAMETTLIPSVQEAGTKLKEQQKGQTWAGRASEYMNKSLDENWPVADRGDALSGLVYDFGEFLPFLSTLSATPNASLSGVSMKLPINLATISATGEYSQSQDFAKTIEAAGVGAADGAAIMMLGMGAGKAGQWTSQHLSKTIKPGMAGLVGASSNAAILTTGGAMHSVGNQLMHNGEVDWDQVRSDGMFWLMFGGEGIVRSAASAYHLAPRSVIQEARRYEVDIETLRERSIELAEKASKEPDPRKKTEMLIGASQLYKFADLKGMERIVGENKDAAIKSVLDSKLSATEKQELTQKIEESAAYLEQRRQTRELETAGDKLKTETAEKASEKPVEPLSPESEGKVPLESKKPSADTIQPSITLERDTKTEKIRGEDHLVYRVKDKAGEQLGLVTLNKRADVGGYVIENALIDKPRRGTGTEAYKQIAKELDSPIISDVRRNQTEPAKKFWEKLEREGRAEKFTDKYGDERYRTTKEIQKEAPKTEIEVSAAGQQGRVLAHTKGVFRDKDGNLYKSTETKKGDSKTQEATILSELSDLPTVVKAGEVVKTSQGEAFKIEKLSPLEKGDKITMEEYNALLKDAKEIDNRGIFVGESPVLGRDVKGNLKMFDFSTASKKTEQQKGDANYSTADVVKGALRDRLSVNDLNVAKREAAVERRQKMNESLKQDKGLQEEGYQYTLKQRPFSIGTQPKEGLIGLKQEGAKSKDGHYGVIEYNRPLTEKEVAKYELEYKGRSKEKYDVDVTKTETDATKKPSTTEVPVGDQAKTGKEVREGDTKAPEKEPPKKSERSIAEEAAESFSISMKPETVNKQAEKLKQKMQDAKLDKKAKDDLLKGFLDANKAKIKEAGLSAADLKKLRTASTWTQVGRTIQKLTTEMAKPTPKMRAAAMEDFIRGNKGAFKGLNSRAVESMMKKIAKASNSDAMLDRVRFEIEDALMKKEVREEMNQKADLQAEMLKYSGEKAILERKGKKGEKSTVKKGIRTETGEVTDRLIEIGEFIEKGRSSKTPDPKAEIDRINSEIDRIHERHETGQQEISLQEVRRIEDLKERLIDLEFSNLEGKSVEQLQELRDYVKDLNKDGRTKARQEADARIEIYTNLTRMATQETAVRGQRVVQGKGYQKQVKTFDFFGDTSWPSLMSKISAGGSLPDSRMVFGDKLNRELTMKYVNKSETRLAELDNLRETYIIKGMKDAFGSERKGHVRLIDARKTQQKTGVFVKDALNRDVELKISETQGMEKLLQARDAEWLETLTRPVEQGGNGFTSKTFEQLEKFVGQDVQKFGNYLYENQKIWGKDIYNPVYKKLNGIDIADFSQGYWPGHKDSSSPYAKGFDDVPPAGRGLSTNRAKRRTGAKAPLEYTDVFETYLEYVGEASRYAAWAESHKTLSYVLRNPEVVKNIKTNYGTRAYDNVNYFLDKFSGKSERQTLDFIDYITNATGQGILAVKTMTGLKQTLSSMYYAIDMPAKKLAEGMAKSFIKGTIEYKLSSWIETDPFVQSRKNAFLHRDMAQHSRFIMAKEGANELSNDVRRALAKARVNVRFGLQPAKELQNTFIRLGDKMPITKAGAGYLNYKYQQYAGKKLTSKVLENHISGKRADKNLEQAHADWLMMSSMTQQSVRESNVSKFRGSGSLQRGATHFTSGQAQIWRVTQESIRNFDKAQRDGNTKGMMDAAKTFTLTHLISGLVFGLADNRFQIKGNEKDILMSIAMGNLSGVALIGKGAVFVQDKLTGKPWADAALTSIPSVDLLSDLFTHVNELGKGLGADSKDVPAIRKHTANMMRDFATINGVGIEGTLQLIGGASRVIKDESDTPFQDIMGWGGSWDPMAVDVRKEKFRKEADKTIGWTKDGQPTFDEEAIIKTATRIAKEGINPIEIYIGRISSEKTKFKNRQFGGINAQKEFDKRMAEALANDDVYSQSALIGMYPQYSDEVMSNELINWKEDNNIEEAIEIILEMLEINKEWVQERREEMEIDQSQEND